MAFLFALNLTFKCFIFIYQLITSKNIAFNKHDNNAVCCTGLGGLICNAITYIKPKPLYWNCYHATIFSIYYVHCQNFNNMNLCFLRASVTTQNNYCSNVANEQMSKNVYIYTYLAPLLFMFWPSFLYQT